MRILRQGHPAATHHTSRKHSTWTQRTGLLCRITAQGNRPVPRTVNVQLNQSAGKALTLNEIIHLFSNIFTYCNASNKTPLTIFY
jgi:hypothetical protein